MLGSWKGKIDSNFAKKQEEENRKQAKKYKKALEPRKKKKSKKIRSGYKRLANFKCHIKGCERHSYEPQKVAGSEKEMDGKPKMISDWSQPADMWKCSKCSHWTCPEHIYKQICMECAQKL